MNGAFSIALSSLQGNQDAISATGQNLANLNTTGYKGNFVEFRDLVAQSASATPGTQQGLGIMKPVVQTVFSDGGIQSSSSSYAAAIQGDGFFVVQSASDGRQLYTRDGDFTIDANGFLKTQSGELVQGWNENQGVLNTNSSAPSAIQINASATAAPQATSKMSFTANLNAASTAATGATELTVPISTVDSLGQTHTVSVNFQKSPTAASWNYSITVPATDVTAGSPTTLQQGSINFNPDGTIASRSVVTSSTSGTITTATTTTYTRNSTTVSSTSTDSSTSPATVTTTPATTSPSSLAAFSDNSFTFGSLSDKANNMTIDWSLVNNDATATGKLTQYSSASQYDSPSQNGLGAGRLTKVAMSDGGQLVASFSNGQTRPVSQLALAKFVNNDSLIGVGNNNFSTSVLSSQPSVGVAGSKGLGTVISSALEGSNVDMSTQFTNLITYQRGYQASSKVITTANQMLDDIVQLIR